MRNEFTKDSSSTRRVDLSSLLRKKSVWSDLPYRLSTICVGVPSLWMLWCNDTLRFVSFQVIHVLCCYEYIFHVASAYRKHDTSWLQLHQCLFVASSLALVNVPPSYFPPALLLVLSFVTILIIAAIQHQDSARFSAKREESEEEERARSSLNMLRILLSWYQGIFFIMLPFRSWMSVTTSFPISPARPTNVSGFIPTVSLLFTVWNCDTGALVFGRIFGKKYSTVKTASNSPTDVLRLWLYYVSPSKSLEGLFGGVLSGIVTYVFLLPRFWYLIDLYRIPTGTTMTLRVDSDIDQCEYVNGWFLCFIGCVLSLSSILGDVIESVLKRLYHCKDSGRLLPGHGGIYDRFDSSLVAVMVYLYCFLNDQGHHSCSIVATRGY